MTATAPAWSVEIESIVGEDVGDARLEALADHLEALTTASRGTLAGPIVGAHIPTGTLRLAITVEAPTPEDAARQAAAVFRQATGAGIGALRVAQAEAIDPLPVGA